jgi:hypothetical protein
VKEFLKKKGTLILLHFSELTLPLSLTEVNTKAVLNRPLQGLIEPMWPP